MKRRLRNVLAISLVLLMALSVVSCGAQSAGLGGKETQFKYNRIISMAPSLTEIIFSLGAGDRVVGVTDCCNYPEKAQSLPKMGMVGSFNAEAIIAQNPDCVFILDIDEKYSGETINILKKSNIKVVSLKNPEKISDVYDCIKQAGELLQCEDKATDVVSQMKDKIELARQRAAQVKEKKSVFVEVSAAPEIFTTGASTYFNEMLEIIGAENVFKDQSGWVKVSDEQVVKKNPDVILTTVGYVPNEVENIRNYAPWKNVKAVSSKQVFLVNEDIVSRPSPRLSEGVWEIGKAVYPEIFN